MKKKIFLMGMVGIASLILITGCGCEKQDKEKEETNKVENEIVENNNENVIKDQTLEVFKFTDTSLVYEKAISKTTLEAIVTNTSDVDQTLAEFKIKVYNGEELMIELAGFVGDVIKAGESRTINTGCGEDLSKATRIEYSVVR